MSTAEKTVRLSMLGALAASKNFEAIRLTAQIQAALDNQPYAQRLLATVLNLGAMVTTMGQVPAQMIPANVISDVTEMVTILRAAADLLEAVEAEGKING